MVVDRPEELEGERLGLEVVQERELPVELKELLVGSRKEEVREVADVGEPEGSDLGLQLRVELAHPPHPRVLERVVPRRDEDVEAEHGLDHRRVGERDRFALLFGQDEPDRHVRTQRRRGRTDPLCEIANRRDRRYRCGVLIVG